MISAKILVADDESYIRDVLTDALTADGYTVHQACDGREAIKKLDEQHYDVIITDLKMPHASGIDVLRHIQEANLPTIGILATAYGTIDSAIEALKLGAREYLTKPFHLGELKITVDKALKFHELQQENQELKEQIRAEAQFENIVGESPAMRRLFELMRVVARDADSTVMIEGDSGTGKELVARAIHYNSPRKNKPLVPVNCGAMPETLLESELFGHVKGAFTGAHADRQGRFALANGGTIFLDEVGEMSPTLQVKVLRVLQEQEFEPVGSVETAKVNVRVIAATNRNLEQMVQEKTFREDLFFRLNVIPIRLPPLRERREDIPLLLDHFIRQFNEQKGKKVKGYSDEAIQLLCANGWRGNVRELENLVERTITFAERSVIEAAELPDKFRRPTTDGPALQPMGEFPDEGVDLNKLVQEFETRLIRQALSKTGGVKNQAATLLQIKRTTLVEKMKKRTAVDPTAFL